MHRNELFYIAFLLLLRLGLSSCSPAAGQQLDTKAQRVKNLYLAHVAGFDSAVHRLESAGKQLVTDTFSVSEFRSAFIECRKQYKRCEVFAEYFCPAAAKEINGAARDEVEENDPNQFIKRAEGLQVIEGLVFPSFDTSDAQNLLVLLKNLKSASSKLATIANSSQFSDAQIFEAVKFELVRIISLGITGFDAMVVQTSIHEAKEALASLAEVLAVYSDNDPDLYGELNDRIAHACEYVSDDDNFASFDRVSFIRDHINPIYRQVTAFQQAAGVTGYRSRRPLRSNTATVFDRNAFDPSYYAPTPEQPTKDQVELGRALFFDPVLSKNNRRACASCHEPGRAFTDGKDKSIALDFNGNVGRNSPTLLNSALQRAYFYDSRVSYLEDQVVAVMTSHKEFDCTPEEIVAKLSKSEDYVALFKRAFHTDVSPITSQNVKTALANFVRSLTGLNSPFDQYMRGESRTLPENVRRGFNLFTGKAKCATCHFVPLFNGTVPPYFDKSEFEILGIFEKPDTLNGILDSDLGRMNIDRIGLNRNGFKTPTVRNVGLTAPYMHNGAYQTLEDVLHFYDHGGAAGIGLDVPNQTLPSDKLNLTKREMSDIIAFLHSLNDTSSVVTAPKALPKFSSSLIADRRIGGEY